MKNVRNAIATEPMMMEKTLWATASAGAVTPRRLPAP